MIVLLCFQLAVAVTDFLYLNRWIFGLNVMELSLQMMEFCIKNDDLNTNIKARRRDDTLKSMNFVLNMMKFVSKMTVL